LEKILISACLLGKPVRYDAGHCLLISDIIASWEQEGRLVPLCPEMAGGLPVPRPPCEKDAQSGRILDLARRDYTRAFEKGAEVALSLVQKENIRFALLKENSPSCGVNFVYDGTFKAQKIKGSGMTAAILRDYGVHVFSENEIEDLVDAIQKSNIK
jgi:uncharacterized protein YbbK (DUF523 family)